MAGQPIGAWARLDLPLEQASDALQTPSGRSDFTYPETEVSIHQDDFAASHDLVAHNQIDWIGNVPVQLHHIAGPKIQNLSEGHFPAAETERGFEFNVE
jgi:hypothetical protein